MKVLFVLNIATPYRDQILARIASENDIDVTALYCSRSDPMRDWKLGSQGNYEAIYLGGLNIGGSRGGFRWRLNPRIGRTMSELRPGLVVVGGYLSPTMQLAIGWCRKNDVPFILLSESHNLRRISKVKERVKAYFLRKVVKRASAFLAASPPAADYLAKWGAQRERIFLFPNVPDPAAFKRSPRETEAIKEAIPPAGPPTLLFVGRLIPIKNVETLLKAFELVKRARPKARLLIAGNGPSEGSLKRRTRELALEGITFMGFVSQARLPPLYSAAVRERIRCDVEHSHDQRML